jgi:YHS domain-containing protein
LPEVRDEVGGEEMIILSTTNSELGLTLVKEQVMRRTIAVIGPLAAMLILGAGCRHEGDHAGNSMAAAQPMSESTSQHAAVDLHNTVCPVSGDKVGDSKLTEVYQGKIYHLCCDDCPKDFKKNPDKFAKAVAADPAKYGVK